MDITNHISGKFLSHLDIETGDKIIFLDEGVEDVTQFRGKEKIVVTFQVKLEDEQEKLYSPNATSMRKLAESWGVETKQWIRKSATLTKVQQLVAGELKWIVLAQPTQMDISPKKKTITQESTQEEIEEVNHEIEEKNPGINVSDIPF